MRAGIGLKTLGSSALLVLLASGFGARAQSVDDYRLPDPRQTPAPRSQGPVDPDNPYSVPARPPRIEPSATPSPTPTAAPRIVLPAPRATPTPAATPTSRTPRPSAAPQTEETPATVATPAPVPQETAPAPEPVLTATATPTAPATVAPSPVAAEDEGTTAWSIAAALAVVAVLAGAFLILRRRSRGASRQEDLALPAADPQPQPPPRPRPAPDAPVKAPPQPVSPPAEPLVLVTEFAPQAVRLSLVYATLQYVLELANPGPEPLPPLQVRADLSSAHASLDTRQQLAPDPQQLEAKHEVLALAPGETTTLKGELRVPLSQIRPLTKGSAQFFVPLARFHIHAPGGGAVRRVFSVGPRDAGSGAIASIRLDAGPRNLRDLDAREIEAARGLALDPPLDPVPAAV